MKIIEKLKENKKIAVIVVLGFICLILLVASEFITAEDTEEKSKQENVSNVEYGYAEEIEIKLTSMISSISGAGNTKVMVTLESSSESVFAQNKNISENKDESEYILIKSGSAQGGMLLKIISPKVRGVAVVCEGGASATVRQEITDMVTSVLDISSNRVSVIKMK